MKPTPMNLARALVGDLLIGLGLERHFHRLAGVRHRRLVAEDSQEDLGRIDRAR
jgi:hypothetical protein